MNKLKNITWKPHVNSDLINSPIVKAHHETPTLREIHPDELTTPLQMLLLTIAQSKQLKCDTIEIQTSSAFVCKYFKDFTLGEIKLSFEFESAGMLTLPNGFGSYGAFSLDYIGGVLKAAREFRIQETRKENLKLGTIDNAQTRILTAEEIEEKNNSAMKQGVLQSFEYFVEHKKMEREPSNDLVSAFHYDFLRIKEILIAPDKDLRNEIKIEALQYLKEQIKLRQRNSSRKESKSIGQEISQIEESDKLQTTCKKIGVRIFFESLMLDGTELKELLIEKSTK